MYLHQLPKIVRRKKRLGRGIGSRGAKSGRGQKGQRSRAGSHHKAGFEGGQTPLYMRLPKGRGTKQFFSSQVEKPEAVSVARLNQFSKGTIVGPTQLWKRGLITNKSALVKVIGNAEVTTALTLRVHKASRGAQASIEKAGGTLELISQ